MPQIDSHRIGRNAGRWARGLRAPSSAVLVVVAVVVLRADGATARPQFANDSFRDRHVVDRLAPTKIQPGYACAVVTAPAKGKSRSLLIYTVNESAAKRARALKPKLFRPGHTRVRITSKRFRQRSMERVLAGVKAYQPHSSAEASALALESPLDRRRCPRVEITLLPEGEASAALEHWAQEMRGRYGDDRVVVRRAKLTLR
jgi:hypothetical protein